MKRLLTSLTLSAALALLLTAAGAYAAVTEIGSPPAFTTPGCPTTCSAVGRVTGYQVQVGTTKNPFVVSQAGKIVAFTIGLGKPNASQTKFFTSTFGGTPEARLSVLRPLSGGRGFLLVSESEVFNLQPYLGSTPTFALSTPLAVPARSVIALTVPTWVPAFTVNLTNSEAWRSSRTTNCNDAKLPATQEVIGTTRSYSCLYRKARLVYSASFVPNPTPTSGSRAAARRAGSAHRR